MAAISSRSSVIRRNIVTCLLPSSGDVRFPHQRPHQIFIVRCVCPSSGLTALSFKLARLQTKDLDCCPCCRLTSVVVESHRSAPISIYAGQSRGRIGPLKNGLRVGHVWQTRAVVILGQALGKSILTAQWTVRAPVLCSAFLFFFFPHHSLNYVRYTLRSLSSAMSFDNVSARNLYD
jgi:hypothetical protein